MDADLFDRAEGRALVDGPAAVLKGALESDIDCAGLIVDHEGLFQRLLDCREDPDVGPVLQRHRFVFAGRTTAERRLVEAGRLAARGSAIAMVMGSEVPRAAAAIARGGDSARRGLVALAIDDPEGQPGVAPRRHFADLGMPVVEPGDLDGLRMAIEQAATLSDAAGGPAAIVVDESILRSAATLELRPDRVVSTRDTAAALRRSRIPRSGKDEQFDRFARRLELDTSLAMPSPGETEELGIIATGLAATSVRHILEEFRLTGRVPSVLLRLVHPLDPAPVERLLTRCRTVVVIETRPGLLAPAVIEIGERLRASGETVATIGWRSVPGVESDPIEVGEASRPSTLVRRILPGLQRIRSGLAMGDRLARPFTEPVAAVPDRPSGTNHRLLQLVRRAAVAADRALRREQGEDAEPIALAINGRPPTSFNGRVVATEIVERRRLLEEAVPLLAGRDPHAARVILVAEEGWSDGLDAVRVLEGAVPVGGDKVARVRRVEAVGEADVRDAIMLAARSAAPEVLVVHRRESREVTNIEELDRLGYAPILRVRSRLDDACGVRARNEFRIDSSLPRPDAVRSEFTLESSRGRLRGRWVARVARLLEISEIVRQREPLPATPLYLEPIPPPPPPRHREHGRWRAHIAGMRGLAPGAAATLLIRAGRVMGFDARLVHQPDRLSPGMGAWAQILFTRPARAGGTDTLVPGTPYGEADLVLGVDPGETARALASDEKLRVATPGRTTIIADQKGSTEESEAADDDLVERLTQLAAEACGTSDDRVDSFVDRVQGQFGNTRLLDVVLLGVAFQLGLVPVTTEAIEQAIVETEQGGFGRTGQAFRFGRMISIRSHVARPATDGLTAIDRRRRELVLAGRMRRGRASARSLDERIGRALARLPGLAETNSGRKALDDLLMAIGRLHRRGGLGLVDDYLERLAKLHAADRGDTGRELTRRAVLVLGEAMLPRDMVAYAIAATSLDHRRRKHRRFGIRRARGDRVDRALLTRIDLIGFERHLRMEIPVPVSMLALVARIGRLVPALRSGDAVSRRRRAAIQKAVEDAITSASDPEGYRFWAERLREWEALAIDGRLQDAPVSLFE
ncbi:MAG: hypothetical protein CMJ34_12000 [Phycisphaerae bacterium]|nr:hypothetical protein [Phycisphaerae bacterium]